jgi:hypothetical protein
LCSCSPLLLLLLLLGPLRVLDEVDHIAVLKI